MYECPKCNSQHSDGVICANCEFSYCFDCANITEKSYRKLGTTKRASLLCTKCKAQPKVQVPVGSLQPGVSSEQPTVSSVTLDQVLQELRNGVASINVRLEQLPALIQEFKDVKDKFQQFETSMTNKTSVLEQRVTNLESRIDSDDYPLLQTKVAQLTADLALKEQRDRSNNIEIKGVPMKKNENLVKLVCKLAETLGQQVLPSDINFVTRSRSSVEIKPIIVGFLGRYLKENVVAAARSQKNLTTAALGLAGEPNRIYINDHLTRDNKLLLNKTKKLVKEMNYRFIWVQNCKILVRKSETSPIVQIQSEDDFRKIK